MVAVITSAPAGICDGTTSSSIVNCAFTMRPTRKGLWPDQLVHSRADSVVHSAIVRPCPGGVGVPESRRW